MKKILLLFLLFITLFFCKNSADAEFTVPQQKGYVNDYAKVLSPDAFIKLDKIVSEIKAKTGVEIFVVTIDSTDGYPISVAGKSIRNNWVNLDGDSIIILLAADKPQITSIVTRGFLKYLSLKQLDEILTSKISQYSTESDYNEGLIYGTYTIANAVAQKNHIELSETITPPKLPKTYTKLYSLIYVPLFLFMAIVIIVGLFIRIYFYKRYGNYWVTIPQMWKIDGPPRTILFILIITILSLLVIHFK